LAQDDEYEASYDDNRLGWARVAGGGLDVHVVPGNHGTMREEPLVEHLAAELSACLHRAELSGVRSPRLRRMPRSAAGSVPPEAPTGAEPIGSPGNQCGRTSQAPSARKRTAA